MFNKVVMTSQSEKMASSMGASFTDIDISTDFDQTNTKCPNLLLPLQQTDILLLSLLP